jgi:hypothetical protein
LRLKNAVWNYSQFMLTNNNLSAIAGCRLVLLTPITLLAAMNPLSEGVEVASTER